MAAAAAALGASAMKRARVDSGAARAANTAGGRRLLSDFERAPSMESTRSVEPSSEDGVTVESVAGGVQAALTRAKAANAARLAARAEAAARAAEVEAKRARALCHAATVVQSHVRGAAARSQIAAEKNAIVAAQMAVRRWVLRRKWRRMQTERREAAAAAAAAEETRRVAEAETNAAVFIQSAYRGAAARGRYAEERAAVIRAQLATRRWLLRSRCLRRREAREAAEAAALEAAEAKARLDAVVFLQARARGAAARGRYEADRAAVIAAQMAARRWALRRKWKRNADARRAAEAAAAAAEEAARTHAATFIQPSPGEGGARAVLPRSRRASETSDGCAAVGASTKVETPGIGAAGEGGGARGGEDRRGGGSGAGERGDARAGARARDARGWTPRSRASHQAPDGCAAVGSSDEVGRLQRQARREADAAAAGVGGVAPERAAVIIQSRLRGGFVRGCDAPSILSPFERLGGCAAVSVRWLRKCLESEPAVEKEAALEAAKIAEAEARAQANAATLVQAHVRGMLARGQYSRDRELVIKLQMAARRWVLRMKWGRLQRARREAEAAAAAAAEASARNRAAVIIQSRLRGGFVRKRRAEYLVALRRLQMAVRRWVLRMKWKRLESERLEKEAALEAAKIAEAEARAQANAATLAGAVGEGMLARGQYSRDRELVIKLQMAARRWVLRMKWGRLQRARREAEAAAAAAAEASARNRAAVIIQSRLRGGFVRKRRAEYLVALRRLQMAVRRWVLRMKWKRLESERLENAATRQAHVLEAAKIAEAEARAQANSRRSCRRTCEGCSAVAVSPSPRCATGVAQHPRRAAQARGRGLRGGRALLPDEVGTPDSSAR